MIKIQSTGLFLQARLNSNRMPGKALLNLAGKTLLLHVMERLSVVPADHRVIVTSQESAPLLKPIAAEAGWEIFVGHSHNVLKRFVDAALHYGVDTILRATGDNPLSSSEIAIETLALLHKKNADLAYLAPVPYGSGVEAVRTTALLKALSSTWLPYDLEHVTPFIYKNKNEFKVVTDMYHNSDAARSDIRVTVDTREDFEKMNFFFRKINERKMNMTLHSLVNVWDELDFSKYRTLLIITTAGEGAGVKHLKRMLVLAKMLVDSFQVTITLQNETVEGIKLINNAGFDYETMSDVISGVSKRGMYDRLIVDAGDTDTEMMALYNQLGPVYSIDDAGSGVSGAYFSVNTGFIPENSGLSYNFQGLPYTITAAEKTINVPKKGIRNILIAPGGEDPAPLTNKLIHALESNEYKLTVISGPFSNSRIHQQDNVSVVYSPDDLYDLISRADLVITSPGLTLLETLRLETPALAAGYLPEHDEFMNRFQYPYYAGFSVFSDDGFASKIQSIVDKMNVDGCFNGADVLDSFYSSGIGEKLHDLINVIQDSRPSVLLCRNCCSPDVETAGRTDTYTMYTCSQCGMYFSDYINGSGIHYEADYFLNEYKEQYGRTYEEDREVIREFAARRLKEIKKYKSSGSLLDFGSGLGFFAEYAKENGFKPVCYDISAFAVNYIKEKMGIEAYQADQIRLETSDDLYDVIASYYVIEHIPEFEKLIFMFYQHLKADGVLSLSTPNGTGYSIGRNFKTYFKKHPADHCVILNPEMLRSLLKKHGFKKIKVVITGIHPSRMIKSEKILNNSFLRTLIYLYMKYTGAGDTFEIYAQK